MFVLEWLAILVAFGVVALAAVFTVYVSVREGGWAGATAVVVVVVVMLLAVGNAHAATYTVTGGSPADQAMVQRVVARAKVPVVPSQMVVLAPCPGYEDYAAGCNFETLDSPIYIVPAYLGAEVLYREMGGRFETVFMNPGERHRFATLTHHRGVGPGLSERFEDAYADCALGITPPAHLWSPPDVAWIDSAGYDPSPRTHRQVCGLIRRAAVRF